MQLLINIKKDVVLKFPEGTFQFNLNGTCELASSSISS